MQIVIDISEDTYDWIKKHGYLAKEDIEYMSKSVANGTPLPRGHGRLIDADEFNQQLNSNDYDSYGDYSNTFDQIEDAPTILKKDKN